MYTVLWMILLGLALFLTVNGVVRQKKTWIGLGIVLGVFSVFFFWLMSFWGEMLWFDALGYTDRFWTVFIGKLGTASAGGIIGLAVMFLLTLAISRDAVVRLGAVLTGTLAGALWGSGNWDVILKYLNRVSTSVQDPVLGKDVGFYFFILPLYNSVYDLFLSLNVIALFMVTVSSIFTVDRNRLEIRRPNEILDKRLGFFRTAAILFGILFLILAWGQYLNRYYLMYSRMGAVTGAGWTDVHIRMPGYSIMTVILVLIGVLLLFVSIYGRLPGLITERLNGRVSAILIIPAVCIAAFALYIIILHIAPGLFQWLRVEPNEITYEKEYIAHNIEFTRRGFNLHKVEERQFPASEQLNRSMVDGNEHIFSNIRIWDYRALDSVYKQFQEIRLYYEFHDVDIDRYYFDGKYRQVMISGREMEISNLPPDSRTFVNKRFKYTHGYGLAMNKVNEFTSQGLPRLLIQDIPPRSEHPSLEVTRPEIYYGELTNEYVVVNSEEKEFDYPSGDKNVYTRYSGDGGIPISNIWRKFIYGKMFGGTRLFLSNYASRKSRIMFHRNIRERVQKLAPFLRFDDDPYLVLADGELYWMMDAYTTSRYYPYSEPYYSGGLGRYDRFSGARGLPGRQRTGYEGINYIRNSVKTVINAYNGKVDFYVFDDKDPLLRVWQKIFPDLFKERSSMPEKLLNHIRYPADLLLAQGIVFAKYHMTDPTVFYNQEDLWVQATEKYYNRVQPVQPYYIMWESPDRDEPEYVLIQPFTPKNKQVMIGWIAGMCDPGNYGRFLAYKFPKEKRVLGPQQVETKIDQDSFLSGQLTLWDQRGSNVIRGNILAIPVADTLLYVEPVYLKAETAAYPELRLVILMHADKLSYAETFDEALKGLISKDAERKKDVTGLVGERSVSQMIRDANTAFEDYLKFQGEKKFKKASESIEELENLLKKLLKDNTKPGREE